jgi:hypothetical protein
MRLSWVKAKPKAKARRREAARIRTTAPGDPAMSVGLHHGLARRPHAATLPYIRAIKAWSYIYTTFYGKSASKLSRATLGLRRRQDLDRFKTLIVSSLNRPGCFIA